MPSRGYYVAHDVRIKVKNICGRLVTFLCNVWRES